MKTQDEVIKRIEFLEKDYEIGYRLQGKLDMGDEDEAAQYDKMCDELKETKTKIDVLKWVLY